MPKNGPVNNHHNESWRTLNSKVGYTHCKTYMDYGVYAFQRQNKPKRSFKIEAEYMLISLCRCSIYIIHIISFASIIIPFLHDISDMVSVCLIYII